MGELTPMDLRTLASHQHYDAPLRQALQWAADRIDYLEGFIEAYEAEEARRPTPSDNSTKQCGTAGNLSLIHI